MHVRAAQAGLLCWPGSCPQGLWGGHRGALLESGLLAACLRLLGKQLKTPGLETRKTAVGQICPAYCPAMEKPSDGRVAPMEVNAPSRRIHVMGQHSTLQRLPRANLLVTFRPPYSPSWSSVCALVQAKMWTLRQKFTPCQETGKKKRKFQQHKCFCRFSPFPFSPRQPNLEEEFEVIPTKV